MTDENRRISEEKAGFIGKIEEFQIKCENILTFRGQSTIVYNAVSK